VTVYAPVPTFAAKRRHPSALTLIVIGHAVLIAAVMSARMDLPLPTLPQPTKVELIPLPKPPPPPEPVRSQPRPEPRDSVIDQPRTIIPVPTPDVPGIDQRPIQIQPIDPGPIGPRLDPLPPQPQPQPNLELVRTGPRFATPPHALRPPYPQSKLQSGEEATLRLRLAIDERGRVTSVEPVGSADPAFLEAARRHILARWRYRPATEDGRAVASSTVVSLRFELND